MTEQAVRHAATALLKHYSFDLGGYTADQLVQHWLEHFPAIWLRMAIVEALYQGRYKAVSVDQILTLWHRRSQPVCHYNHEFERMICNRFPRNLLKDEDEPGLLVLADVGGADRSYTGSGANWQQELDLPESDEPVDSAREPSRAIAEANTATDVEPIAPQSEPTAIEPAINNSNQTTFEPSAVADGAPVRDALTRDEVIRQPIHQFVPSGEPPEFYTRMRAASFSDDDFLNTSDSVSSFN